jgi:HD-GYP domain-containing protein (c-di-GMP phosphodiesterase class II)
MLGLLTSGLRRKRVRLSAERLLEDGRDRRSRSLANRDVVTSLVIGGAFAVVATSMALLLPTQHHPSPLVWLALIGVYAAVSRVEFEVGSGAGVPTQLVLVPMLFLLPPSYVPLVVLAGMVIGTLPDSARGALHPARILVSLVSSWHAVGPALVLTLAGGPEASWSVLPLLTLAFATQVLADGVSATTREYLAFRVDPRELTRYLSWIWVVDALLAPVGLAIAIACDGAPYGFLVCLPLVGLLRLFARERSARMTQAIELSSAYRGTAFLLGDVVEADDAYTGAHSRGVVELTLAVADAMGLDATERRDAEFAALLHDVGKLNVPKEIINKPGALTPEEREIIETHTLEGERILDQVGGVLGEVGRIVRSCHERWDGGGYPDGLAGEEIPLIARIVCACDAYSAMTTDRSYRKALSPHAAVEELHRCSGTQFDPAVIELLTAIVEQDLPSTQLMAA